MNHKANTNTNANGKSSHWIHSVHTVNTFFLVTIEQNELYNQNSAQNTELLYTNKYYLLVLRTSVEMYSFMIEAKS